MAEGRIWGTRRRLDSVEGRQLCGERLERWWGGGMVQRGTEGFKHKSQDLEVVVSWVRVTLWSRLASLPHFSRYIYTQCWLRVKIGLVPKRVADLLAK